MDKNHTETTQYDRSCRTLEHSRVFVTDLLSVRSSLGVMNIRNNAMTFSEKRTEQLLRRINNADGSAIQELLELHRSQLRKAVIARFDNRLQGRVDPSDVIQDTMIVASKRLQDYLENPTIPFYPWLRAIAMNRLTDLYRYHVLSKKRGVDREESAGMQLSDASIVALANRISAGTPSPSENLKMRESQRQVYEALESLKPEEREVLVLTYLEDMSSSEIASIQGITERSVRRRHRQAIENLGKLMR